MKQGRASLSVIFLTLALLLTGCAPKPMQLPALLTDFKPYEVTIGSPFNLYPALPEDLGKAQLTVTVSAVSPNLEAQWKDNRQLVVDGITQGDGSVELTLTAKGYETAKVSIPFNVKLPRLNITASGKGSTLRTNPQGGYWGQLNMETPATVEFSSDHPFTLTVQPVDTDILTAAINDEGNILTLTPLKPGKTTITATATDVGHLSEEFIYSLEVLPINTRLTLADSGANVAARRLAVGQSTQIPLVFDGAVTVTTASPFAESHIEGNLLKLTGIAIGNGTVTLTATQEGYLNTTMQLDFSVSQPVVKPKEIPTEMLGEIPAVDPVSDAHAKLLNQIVAITNQRRRDAGLNELSRKPDVDPAAALRAKEASVRWAHVRPDNRGFETVFNDFHLNYRSKGENLASANFAETAEEVMQRWMDSDGHRAAILHTEFTGIGVGIYVSPEGEYFYTQLFTS